MWTTQRGKDKTFYKHQHLRYIGIEREALKKGIKSVECLYKLKSLEKNFLL